MVRVCQAVRGQPESAALAAAARMLLQGALSTLRCGRLRSGRRRGASRQPRATEIMPSQLRVQGCLFRRSIWRAIKQGVCKEARSFDGAPGCPALGSVVRLVWKTSVH
jgi:hypothetical protein